MIDNSKEYIICAAVWYKDLPLVNTEILRIRGFSPYNVDKGIVFCGWRHANCIYQMVALTGLHQCEAGEEIQGFLTSKNMFVTREEAAKIALELGQFANDKEKEEVEHSHYLYSENIY